MNSNLNYKGYLAKVEFDDEDRIFVGRIIGIRDIVGFHGESVAELEEAFGQSITLKPAEKSFRQGWKSHERRNNAA